MAKPTLDAVTIEVIQAAAELQLEYETTKEQVKKVTMKLDLAETLVRGAGATDTVTCKPMNSSFNLGGWVIEWVGNQPQGTYKVVLERTATTVVNRGGSDEDTFTGNNLSALYTDQVQSYTFTNLPVAHPTLPTVSVTTYRRTAVINNQEVGEWMVTSDTSVSDGIVYSVNNKVKWTTALRPPTTRVATLITKLPDDTPTGKSYTKGTDWDIVAGVFTWLIPEAQRPLTGELIASGTTEPFTYSLSYTQLTVVDVTRGAGTTDNLPVGYQDILQSTSVVGTKDSKSWNFISPDDYAVYATSVTPPAGISAGASYEFTGTTTTLLGQNDFNVQTADGRSRLLVNKPFAAGSSVVVEYAYSMGPAYS